jgi:hypothetical protein
VVQLYLHDVVAQVARPVKQLAGFARVGLAPGEAVDVTFQVYADRTAYPDRELERIVEPGDIEVMVGTSAADLPCRARLRGQASDRLGPRAGHHRSPGGDRARLAASPLTTVRQPLREMGAVAVRTALRLAAGEGVDSHHVELATELVVRQSTAHPPPR